MKAAEETRAVRVPAADLPVLAEAEVVVVGGGTAGVMAAVAAARMGARTALIEKNGFVGGATTGTYNANTGFWGDSDGNQIIGGIGQQWVDRMARADAAHVDLENVGAGVQTFPEATKLVSLEMLVEAGVGLFLHSWAGDVLVEDGFVKGVVVQSKSGRQVVLGKTFVDASADADVAFGAGAPFEQSGPDEAWQTSVDLTVCNVDPARVVAWAKENGDRLDWYDREKMAAIPEDHDHSGVQRMLTFLVRGEGTGRLEGPEGSIRHKGPVPTVKLMVHRTTARVQGSVEIDATDVRQITWAEIEGRRRAMEHLRYLKQSVWGFENAFVVSASPLGVRETRRIIGEYRITIDDLLNNARFPDVVALNCRALDRHLKDEKFEFKLLEGNHDVPLRALIPQRIQNLLVAGRCISSDHDSNASLRGGATCMATGHAAGVAAALAAEEAGRVRELDVGRLQRLLRKQGTILSTREPHEGEALVSRTGNPPEDLAEDGR